MEMRTWRWQPEGSAASTIGRCSRCCRRFSLDVATNLMLKACRLADADPYLWPILCDACYLETKDEPIVSTPSSMTPADEAIRMARKLPAKYYELLEAYLGLDGRAERPVLDLAKARKCTRAAIIEDLDRAIHLVATALGVEPSYDPDVVYDLLIVGAMREKPQGSGDRSPQDRAET